MASITLAPSFFSSTLRALDLDLESFESFLGFFDFFLESLSRLESDELELESELESLLELELELLAFLFFLSCNSKYERPPQIVPNSKIPTPPLKYCIQKIKNSEDTFSLALSLPLPFFSSPLLSELLALDFLP